MKAGAGTAGAIFESPYLNQLVATKDIGQTLLQLARNPQLRVAERLYITAGRV